MYLGPVTLETVHIEVRHFLVIYGMYVCMHVYVCARIVNVCSMCVCIVYMCVCIVYVCMYSCL